MESFPGGGSVLLGLNSPLCNPSDDSDIDFADVFGGPPRRRSAVHEVMRHSFGETADSYALTPEASGSELTRRRPRWSGRNEKTVFGDELANRRRFTTDDFFDDIFGGNESLSSSPRKKSDPFGSNPGSRVLSPARPLPPKAEPFGTSLPAQFSLPAKLTKGTEIPTFGSPVHSLNKNRDTGLKGSTAYSYSPLSRSPSQANLDQRQENVSNRSASKGVAGDVQEKGVAGSEGSGRGRQFHFSIYKWPNRGVPVVMPLGRWGGSRLRGKAKVEAVAEEIISQPGTLNDVGVTTDDEALRDTESLGIGREAGEDEESDLPPLDVTDKETVAAADESVHTKGKTKPDMLSKLHLSGKPVKEASSDVSESRGIKLKALGSFLFDKDDEQGEGEARKDKSNTKNTRYSSGDSKSEKKPEGRSSLDIVKSAKSSSPSLCLTPGEASKNGVKGKVKEFVKIFNQGASILASGEPLGKSSRWRAKENVVVDLNNTTSVDPTVRMSGEQKKPSPDSPAVEQKPSRVSEKKDPSAQNMKNGGSHGVSGQEDRQESNTAQTTLEDTEEFFHVNFQVKEIIEDDKNLEQTGNDAEETQIINAEVRKWSNGKDGNIRSLLSTLQYILWPESGWKPVPLMDMIEGNAVRRSYQKALLILHPDKLQQKGASASQKYIAEKVFKLLQEAWNHFNSVGPL